MRLALGVFVGILLCHAVSAWSQDTTPCDIRVKIVEQGRALAEQQWAAALAKVQELTAKLPKEGK